MKVLITGNRGFVGSVLEDELNKRNIKTVGMNRDRLNILDQESFDKAGDVDLIVHTAGIVSSALSLEEPRDTYEVNIMGTVNVLEYARKARTPVIHFSSCKVEPNRRGVYGSYGVSKVCMEKIVKDYWRIYGVPYILLRPASIYGPTQDGSEILGWMTWFIKAALAGQEITINGDPCIARDSIYIDDLMHLLLKMVDCFYEGCNKTYEVGGGEEFTISLEQALDFVKDLSGPIKSRLGRYRRGDPESLIMDPSETKEIWGWTPKIDPWEGITKIYGILSENSDNLQQD